MVVPVYIAELASKRLRGRLISLNSLALTLGILTGLVVNVGCSKLSFGWRVSLGLQCLFGIILFAGMAFFPETPRSERFQCLGFILPTIVVMTFRSHRVVQCACAGYSACTLFVCA